ncbi:MAG: 16S rRNA (cytidine(1402)-2'-O)-methyltransferase [Oscillospiraceae bacterium]|nr:16S rRNA (cytidine(1402)-2'-O)-methyltransferase [Oscillospiraceae bacterium]
MAGKLYLVPTPIGNLGDISRRAAEILEAVDFIAAEDTRVTVKLLNHLGLKKPMTAYHRHNCGTAGPAVLERIQAGEDCALVTDAGTPAISDPGEDLVALCAGAGVAVESIPGPCALTVALSVSGLPTARFTFEGFLPLNKKNRRARLDALGGEERTMVFYEAPHKLRATLEDLADAFGSDRPMAVCRELTKLHEEVLRLTIGEAVTRYAAQEPRGEFVLVIAGRPAQAPAADEEGALARALELRREGLPLKLAAARAAEEFGGKKRAIYDQVLEIEGK